MEETILENVLIMKSTIDHIVIPKLLEMNGQLEEISQQATEENSTLILLK